MLIGVDPNSVQRRSRLSLYLLFRWPVRDVPDGTVLVSDQLTLNSNGTYSDFASFSNANSLQESGSWSLNNNLIKLQRSE